MGFVCILGVVVEICVLDLLPKTLVIFGMLC